MSKFLKEYNKKFENGSLKYIELIKHLQKKLNKHTDTNPDKLFVEDFIDKITFTKTKPSIITIQCKDKHVELKGFPIIFGSEIKDNFILTFNVKLKEWKTIEKKLKNIVHLLTEGQSNNLCSYYEKKEICFRYVPQEIINDKEKIYRHVYHFLLPLIDDMKYKGYVKIFQDNGWIVWFIITDY